VPEAGLLDSKDQALPIPIRQPRGCGCGAQGGAADATGMLVIALLLRRRRRGI